MEEIQAAEREKQRLEKIAEMKRIKEEKEAMKKKMMEKGQLENIDEEVLSADGTKKRRKKKKREALDAWEGGGDKKHKDDEAAKKAKKEKKKKDESKKYYEIREKDGNIIKVIRKVKKIKYNVDKDEKNAMQELPNIKSSPEKKKRVILRGGFNIHNGEYESEDIKTA